jgi:uncharacterized membrane protein
VLASWPRVDLVSFYVLRTPYQSSTLGSSGLALIPFPTQDLFDNHLDEFDVIVIHDLEPAEVGLDRYLGGIADFVRKGGAVVLMGAHKSFGPSAMSKEPFASVLPVTLLPADMPRDRLADEAPFRPRLTEAGARHPITRLDEDEAQNTERWKSAVRLDGIMRTAAVPPGAVALVDHPELRTGSAPAPLVAVREAGKGRSMAITTDSLWRLRFTGPMEGGRVDTYGEFWHKAMAWLTRDPELSRLRIKTEPANVAPGELATIEVELLDEAYRPEPGAALACAISWMSESGVEETDSRALRLDDTGRYRFEWTPRSPGPHTISVAATDGTEAVDRFLALSSDVETENIVPDEAFLELLSEASGGRHLPDLGALEDVVIRAAEEKEEVLSREDLPLWDHPMTLAALLALLLSEWLLRRRLGLN